MPKTKRHGAWRQDCYYVKLAKWNVAHGSAAGSSLDGTECNWLGGLQN
jgi:hypothetical protein